MNGRRNISMTRSSRKNVPEGRIDLGTASSIATNQASVPGHDQSVTTWGPLKLLHKSLQWRSKDDMLTN